MSQSEAPYKMVSFLITGLPKCGKTNIRRTVFQSTAGSLLLGPNNVDSDGATSIVHLNRFMEMHIRTMGHDLSLKDDYAGLRSVIFVIDCLDDYLAGIMELCRLVEAVLAKNAECHFDIFLHKIDGISSGDRQRLLRDISRQVLDETKLPTGQISFYLTSLYDLSILHAFSRVIQRDFTPSAEISSLLRDYCSESGYDQAYLFDSVSRICLAASAEEIDYVVFELCSHALDIVTDMAEVYASKRVHENGDRHISEVTFESGHRNVCCRLEYGLSLVCFSRGDTKRDMHEIADRISALIKHKVIDAIS